MGFACKVILALSMEQSAWKCPFLSYWLPHEGTAHLLFCTNTLTHHYGRVKHLTTCSLHKIVYSVADRRYKNNPVFTNTACSEPSHRKNINTTNHTKMCTYWSGCFGFRSQDRWIHHLEDYNYTYFDIWVPVQWPDDYRRHTSPA